MPGPLVGVHDATAKELRRYVDGKVTGTRDWTYTPWNATGPVKLGRELACGVYGAYANGALSNVRIYPTALPPASASATGDVPKVTQLD
ncbi:LamG-like jellyroll fold domain-containing protein [Streptomyces sp. NPDC005476]|uniref:LamG-like jellyroll fold domain-containing protein n=1 Tax=Streptomyces sp. NPDC005476 TaxID=3156882 RepID=UPI0034515585